MRILVFILFIQSSFSWAQVYVSPGAQMTTKSGSVVMVQDMDVENHGRIDHAGEIEVHGNIINDAFWKCDTLVKNITTLTLDWTNNKYFNSGIGTVNFYGANQLIQGSQSSFFYNLNLQGTTGIIKTQLSHAGAKNIVNLTGVECATNGYTFTLFNSNLAVKRTNGYFSTFLDGKIRAIYPVSGTSNTEIPLGFGTASAAYKPFYLIKSPQDSFDITLYGHSASADNKDVLAVDDSVCAVNPFYYYRFITYNSPSQYAFTRDKSEQIYTKIGHWNGSTWSKISLSDRTNALSFDNLSNPTQLPIITDYITHVSETPFVTAGQKYVLQKNETVQLQANGYFPKNSAIWWSPDGDLSCSNCLNPTFTMGSPGILTISVDNGSGCLDTGSVEISTLGYSGLYVPNAFSPNGDNKNEGFGPVLTEYDKLENLKIYNRWGEKLWDDNKNWDGRYLGETVMEGVYVYKVLVSRNWGTQRTEKFYLEGTLTLLR